MPPSVQLTQLARLLGRPDLLAWAGEGGGASDRGAGVKRAVEEGFDRLSQGILEEAAASDDVIDAASADLFIEERLSFLGGLLSEDQRQRLREKCREVTSGWG